MGVKVYDVVLYGFVIKKNGLPSYRTRALEFNGRGFCHRASGLCNRLTNRVLYIVFEAELNDSKRNASFSPQMAMNPKFPKS